KKSAGMDERRRCCRMLCGKHWNNCKYCKRNLTVIPNRVRNLINKKDSSLHYISIRMTKFKLKIKMKKYRIGQIVPSSNVTMETEIPAIFKARETILPERFTFHSSRMRMKKVTKEELEAMDAMSLKCALELSDAHVDVMGYACLVAIMSMGRGYHCVSEVNLHQETIANGFPTPIVTSAGALINGLNVLGAKTVSIITPYIRPLTDMVVDYIEHQGFKVKESIALEIPDNL